MAFDGMVTKAVCLELTDLIGAKIDKVYQPNKNTILLGLYHKGKNYALTICIDSQNCRLHLTTHSKQNPPVASNFCMVLRKNLIGLIIKNIHTFDLERLVRIELEGLDEFDDLLSKKLMVELMGRHSNIILLDDTNKIIDSARHIKEDNETFRDILPHTLYQMPSCTKENFLECRNFDDFLAKIPAMATNSVEDFPTIFTNIFNGISQKSIEFILKKLKIDTLDIDTLKELYNYLNNLINSIGTKQLSIQINSEKDYQLVKKENSTPFSLNFCLDDFYHKKETLEEFKSHRNTLLKLILTTLQKYQKRLKNINQKLLECDDMEKYRIYGELITANLYRISEQKQKEITLENYYEENSPAIKIPLDPRYSPSFNAKKYYKKYHKLKNALEIVNIQKQETLEELDYLESIVYELENSSTLEEVSMIFEEISENVIFQEKTKTLTNKKTQKVKKSKMTKNKTVTFNPIKYTLDGFTILVGKNNRENDYLTLKLANKTDIWFHTKDIHGSHVILKRSDFTQEIPTELLVKVAQIAAFHSKAKNSSNVPVDYCEVKQVKKPSGSKPGMVIYHHNQTLNVNPSDFIQ